MIGSCWPRSSRLFLRSEELELFDAVIGQYGGIKLPNGGWANKEVALLAALTTLMGGEG